MKVLIPVAGSGTRLRPLTNTQPKPLIPIAGKPILSFIIDDLIAFGVTDFIFVIGYMGDKIIQFVEEHYPNIHTEFVVQKRRKGLAHAISICKEHYQNEELLIVLGDTLADIKLEEIKLLNSNVIAIKKVNEPSRFGVAEIEGKNQIISVEEKPKLPVSNFAIIGVYYFKDTTILGDPLSDYVKRQNEGTNEIHFTGFIQEQIKAGTDFRSITISNWLDCGKKNALLDANAKVLSKISVSESGSTINTVIKPPVYIHPSAHIEDCIIGPNVSIGEGAYLSRSSLHNCIIGELSKVQDIFLEHSVVGAESLISGKHYSLNVGDNTEIDLNISSYEE